MTRNQQMEVLFINMDNEIKVSLTIALRGGTMFSKEECLKTTQKEIEKKTKSGKVYKKVIDVVVNDWDKMDLHTLKVSDKNGKNTEVISFHTRKSKPATQTISICKEAYDYMTDSNECPSWVKLFVWKKMDKTKRLESHLQRIMEHLGGVSYSYKVFED